MGSSESTQCSGRGENDLSIAGSAEDLVRKKKYEEMVKVDAGAVAGEAVVGSIIFIYGLASASVEKAEEVGKKKNDKMEKVGAGAVAGAAVVGSIIYGLASASEEIAEVGKKKMMKAPGRKGHYNDREEFEKNPTAHFRYLRLKDN